MNNLMQLKSEIETRRRTLNIRFGERKAISRRTAELKTEIADLSDLTQTLDKVTVLLNNIGEDKQQEAQEKIEGIITRGLQTIFGPTLSFHIVQTVNGKTASVEFYIRSQMGDSVVETPILDSHGGGLAAVVGFMLRVTIMLLDKGTEKANVLILDESFGYVSSEYLEPLGEFVKELIEKTGLQIILVTHQPEWLEYADKTYRFGKKDGATYVRDEN